MGANRPTRPNTRKSAGPNVAMPKSPIAGRLNALARLIHRSALRVYPSEAGLSFVDAAVIGGIGSRGPMSASELAQQLTMHEGQLSRAIQGLEKDRLLTRLRDPADSRRKLLMLTREGRDFHRNVIAVQERRAENLLEGLGRAEREAFFRALDVIAQNAETMLDESADASESGSYRDGLE